MLKKEEILEMRQEARRKIEQDFRGYREEYMETFLKAARKQMLKQGTEKIILDAAATGKESERPPEQPPSPITDSGDVGY